MESAISNKIFTIIDFDFGKPKIVDENNDYFIIIIEDEININTIELVITTQESLKEILNQADSYRISELIGRKILFSMEPTKIGQTTGIKILK